MSDEKSMRERFWDEVREVARRRAAGDKEARLSPEMRDLLAKDWNEGAEEYLLMDPWGDRAAESRSIAGWVRRVYELACEKGWHDEKRPRGEELAIHLMNLHSEISECWEAYRAGKLDQPCDKAERMREMGLKPLTCLEEELADIVIRVMDDAVALDVDLEAAMKAKHAYNVSRPRRHGGKLA